MKKGIRFIIILLWCLLIIVSGNAQVTYSWTSPSDDSSASMPCGGGDIGLNVWVENGDVLFYIARSGTYDEHNALLKQGRIRIRLTPNPFSNPQQFNQSLHLNQGNISISAGKTKIKIWVDVYKPVIHTEIKSQTPVMAEVRFESWRYRDRFIRKGEGQQNSWKWAVPEGLKTTSDSIFPQQHALLFFHQNPLKTIFDFTVKQQGLESFSDSLYNPLAGLISGGKLIAGNFEFRETQPGEYAGTDFQSWIYSTPRKIKKTDFAIALQTCQNKINWEKNLGETIRKIDAREDEKKSILWWKNFYNRSFINIGGKDSIISRNYALFRYMLGCNLSGNAPTRFNGGLFTFDPFYVDDNQAFTPDYRKWGGGTYTAQNQRLVYWPMLKNGDVDLMIPQFEFYLRLLKNAELRTRTYWHHPGACFTEQMEQFGFPNAVEFGLKRPENFDSGVDYNAWIEYEWDTVLEFCQMMLEANLYFNTNISRYKPLIKSAVAFFDAHYQYLAAQRGRRKLDGNGHLIFYPGSACETYKMANNPATTIAGLKRILLTMGDSDSILKRIPPLPFRDIQGKKALAPANSWERINNVETPQLYPVFPWRFYGVGKPALETAIHTFLNDSDAVKFRSSKGWKQDNIWAACLGLSNEAQKLTFEKLADGPYRFPAFWGPDFDWSPDHNKGGSGMIGLQEMLIQTTDDGKILLLPAWPAHLDVHFKLHVTGNTCVEAKFQNGKVVMCQTIPATRMNDLIYPGTGSNRDLPAK